MSPFGAKRGPDDLSSCLATSNKRSAVAAGRARHVSVGHDQIHPTTTLLLCRSGLGAALTLCLLPFLELDHLLLLRLYWALVTSNTLVRADVILAEQLIAGFAVKQTVQLLYYWATFLVGTVVHLLALLAKVHLNSSYYSTN